MDKEELAAYAAQTPLWGSAYAMDIEAMAKLKIPSMLFWTMGKDIHTRWERVNKASLYEKHLAVLKTLSNKCLINKYVCGILKAQGEIFPALFSIILPGKPGIEVSKYFQETAEKGVTPCQSSI